MTNSIELLFDHYLYVNPVNNRDALSLTELNDNNPKYKRKFSQKKYFILSDIDWRRFFTLLPHNFALIIEKGECNSLKSKSENFFKNTFD